MPFNKRVTTILVLKPIPIYFFFFCFFKQKLSFFSLKKVTDHVGENQQVFRSNCTLKGFSNHFKNTKTKKITSSSLKRSAHRDESIRILSNFLQLAQSAGKITQVQGAIVFIYLFIGSKTGARFLSQSRGVAIATA